MREQERPGHHDRDPGDPRGVGPLPPELADFLSRQDLAGLFQATTDGTAFVLKAPRQELTRLCGRIPIQLRHELYSRPHAPVIRTAITFYDDPRNPLAVETYTNIAEPDQHADFAALAVQEELLILGYDETLRNRLAKRVPLAGQEETVIPILQTAMALAAEIPAEAYDFDRAKQAVMEHTSLDG